MEWTPCTVAVWNGVHDSLWFWSQTSTLERAGRRIPVGSPSLVNLLRDVLCRERHIFVRGERPLRSDAILLILAPENGRRRCSEAGTYSARIRSDPPGSALKILVHYTWGYPPEVLGRAPSDLHRGRLHGPTMNPPVYFGGLLWRFHLSGIVFFF